MALKIEALRGSEIECELDALAQLRISVFRAWPYLYEGSADYEKHYLQIYLDCPDSLAVLVWDGEQCVGASTVLPLSAAPAELQKPFIAAGMALDQIDYFGESVLLPAWRGQGLGVKFFELREAHAQSLRLPVCAFCAVERAANDPRRPPGYVPNDAFWQRRGYVKTPELQATMSWPDLGEPAASDKTMSFWLRRP